MSTEQDYATLENKFLDMCRKYEECQGHLCEKDKRIEEITAELKEAQENLIDVGDLYQVALMKISLFVRVPIWRIWWWRIFHPYKFDAGLKTKKMLDKE